MQEKIGTNAGKVWTALNAQTEPQDVKVLRKNLKITEKDLYAALGWLAREEKVAFSQEGKTVLVALV